MTSPVGRVVMGSSLGSSLPIFAILIHLGPGLIAIHWCGGSRIVARALPRALPRAIAGAVFEAAGERHRITKHERTNSTTEESGHIRSAVRALDDDALEGHSPTERTAKIIRTIWHLSESTGLYAYTDPSTTPHPEVKRDFP
jgi:hypothetical protein